MSSREVLLTSEQISIVTEDAKTNVVGKYIGIRALATNNSTFLGILRITDINNLILIKGNQDTGHEHIKSRHKAFNPNVYWKDSSTGFVVEKPTLFPEEIPPYYFGDIADKIYKLENKKENTREGSPFDLYEGECEQNGIREKYRLLVYTNTKIIHTLYPINNKRKQRKITKFDFARGEVIIDEITQKNKKFVVIPYHTYEGIFKYDIFIEKDYLLKEEKIFIRRIIGQDGEIEGSLLVHQQTLKDFKYPSLEKKFYQQADLTSIEKAILGLHKYLIENNL